MSQLHHHYHKRPQVYHFFHPSRYWRILLSGFATVKTRDLTQMHIRIKNLGRLR